MVKSGDISAKLKSISKVHSFGKIGAKRIWFVGLGKEKDLTFDKLKEAFGRLFKEVQKSKLEETAVYLDSFTTEEVGGLDASHALSEALSLSTYQFEGYKQKSNVPEKKLEQVTIYSLELMRKRKSMRHLLWDMLLEKQPILHEHSLTFQAIC